MAAIPTGTVSFLLTDIEGSTLLWSDRGAEMASALATHDRLITDAVRAHRGYVFSKAGDGFAVAFWTPEEALAAAIEAQRALRTADWPGDVRISVRMGIHTGAADEREGDYYGLAVNRAARVMSLAPGGAVLASAAVAELLRDGRCPDVTVIDVGEHPLRGLPGAERIFQVRAEGLEVDATTLLATAAQPGNLRPRATSFVGRSRELTELRQALAPGRAVTVTGPGGVGKTRLAIEAAATASNAFADGVWLVELAPLRDADAVVHATAQVLGAPPQEGLDLLGAIADALRGRSALVVLDNCEHVRDTAARVVERLRAVPTVAVLATSREPLGLAGERVWPLAPLNPALEGLELFCERAASADAGVELGGDRAVVEELCAHLDGLPLAIELAAARIRSMTPADLAAHLDDRFRLLHDRGREVRHHTLRAMVEWSYQSLIPAEAHVFDRLAVMAGSFDLAAVAAVCNDVVPDRADVLDLLDRLVDKSLVVMDRTAGTARYRLLETLRQFAQERLDAAGVAGQVRGRHMAHYVEVAGHARALFEGDANAAGAALFDFAWDNLRAALAWAVDSGDVTAAETIVEAPCWYCHLYARHELGEWAEQVCALPEAGPAAFGAATLMAFLAGDMERAVRTAHVGLGRARSPTDPETVNCWLWSAGAHWFTGRAMQAHPQVQRGVQAAVATGDLFTIAAAVATQGLLAAAVRPDDVVPLAARAREVARPLENAALDAWVDCLVGPAEFAVGERVAAIRSLRRSLALSEQCSPFLHAVVTMSLASVAAHPDSGLQPERTYADAVERLYDLRSWPHLWGAIESLAAFWARTGDLQGAATLLGHLDAQDRRSVALISRRARAASALDGHPEAAGWMAQGAALDRDQLVRYALDRLAAASPPS